MVDIMSMLPSHTSSNDNLTAVEKATCLSVVVVAEDHDDLRVNMIEVIASHGHHVVGLACAKDMDSAVGTLPIDLLVVDVDQPDEDGLSLARRFRAAQPLSGVIIVSARHTVEDKVRGYNSGADVYLEKPVSSEELMAAINNIGRRLMTQRPISSLVETKHFSIDKELMLFSGPQGSVRLTYAEILLLSALSRAPSQRLEVSQLLKLLKLDKTSNSKSAFEVRLVRLRKKMISVGADKLCLRSIRLQGYQLSTVLH
jgi:DNA-binding response OmpR family regulator